jgi:hypothetical protein
MKSDELMVVAAYDDYFAYVYVARVALRETTAKFYQVGT